MTNIASALLCCCTPGEPGDCTRCPVPFTITWTGSCTYTGSCCFSEGSSIFTNEFTVTHNNKQSPEYTDPCFFPQKFTSYDAPVLGEPCPPPGLINPAEFLGGRIRFRDLIGGVDGWQVKIESSGDIPTLSPATLGAGFSLIFRAPGSVCVPTSGWELDELFSSFPILGLNPCTEGFGSGVVCTDFTPGGLVIG